MSTDNSVSFKMEFSNSPNTKQITFGGVSSAALAGVKSKVQAINNSLATSDTTGFLLSSIFVDPKIYDPDSPRAGGNLNKISDVTITQTETTKIPLF